MFFSIVIFLLIICFTKFIPTYYFHVPDDKYYYTIIYIDLITDFSAIICEFLSFL